MSKYSYDDLYKRLYRQHLDLLDGGTSYRTETSRLSLFIADQVKKVTPFLNSIYTKEIVKNLSPESDEERVKDVSKMLYVNARALEVALNRSDEAKAYVANKMKKRGPTRLVKVKDTKNEDGYNPFRKNIESLGSEDKYTYEKIKEVINLADEMTPDILTPKEMEEIIRRPGKKDRKTN